MCISLVRCMQAWNKASFVVDGLMVLLILLNAPLKLAKATHTTSPLKDKEALSGGMPTSHG